MKVTTTYDVERVENAGTPGEAVHTHAYWEYSAPKLPLAADLLDPEEVIDVPVLEPVAEEGEDEASDGK